VTLFKIADLKDGHTNVETSGTILELGEPRSVVTRYGQETKVTHATLEDDSANILLVLWGDQTTGLAKGVKVKITGGYIKSWKGAKQLGIGRKGMSLSSPK
jgi:ssDNA-binding replication factor A large subunit